MNARQTLHTLAQFCLREAIVFVLLFLAGVLLAHLLYYPNTSIELGYGYVGENGSTGPAVILDFETPNAEQLVEFQTIENFETWAIGYVRNRLAEKGIVVSNIRVARVDELEEHHTVIKYVVPWSGLKRMWAHKRVRVEFLRLWTPILILYFVVSAGRFFGWWLRRRANQ